MSVRGDKQLKTPTTISYTSSYEKNPTGENNSK